jgi:hypothetical protein
MSERQRERERERERERKRAESGKKGEEHPSRALGRSSSNWASRAMQSCYFRRSYPVLSSPHPFSIRPLIPSRRQRRAPYKERHKLPCNLVSSDKGLSDYVTRIPVIDPR